MLKGEDELTKRHYAYAISSATAAATTTAATSIFTSIAINCKTKIIKIKITKVYKYTGYQKDIPAIL